MLRRRILSVPSKILSEKRYFSVSSNLLKDDDNESQKKDPVDKLNALLLSISKEQKSDVRKAQPSIQVPKPKPKPRLKKPEAPKNLGSRIVDAVKNVSDKIDGNKKEIEAQLLQKLLYKDTPIKEEILKASSDNQYLADLVKKMQIEREEKVPLRQPPSASMGSSKPTSLNKRYDRKQKGIDRPDGRSAKRVNIFGETPLGIFDVSEVKYQGVPLKTWGACEDREKKLSVTHPPSNYFEQMIDWTEKGIVWKFPIDNEQGLEKEKSVSFASHVLLENHLEGWCPPVGPIRHFMELVCVGLSRNHWLSSQEKEDHIMWYKEFFTERRQLLKEIGAGNIDAQDKNIPS